MYTVKNLALIAVILTLIFSGAFFTNRILLKDAHSLEEKIVTVETSINEKDWVKAQSGITSILNEWPAVENKWALLIDHAEIDNIEDALTKVAEYIKAKETAPSLAELATLKNYIVHIPEKEFLNLKNIF
ncbi:MAG: DUF4363 family protein [Clostridiaceae bacterium]|nr:DUF4363 family protein [Clostridiaceae bacterium]